MTFAIVCELLDLSQSELIDCVLEASSDWDFEQLEDLSKYELLDLLKRLEETY